MRHEVRDGFIRFDVVKSYGYANAVPLWVHPDSIYGFRGPERYPESSPLYSTACEVLCRTRLVSDGPGQYVNGTEADIHEAIAEARRQIAGKP
jgi:hypothetical protein